MSVKKRRCWHRCIRHAFQISYRVCRKLRVTTTMLRMRIPEGIRFFMGENGSTSKPGLDGNCCLSSRRVYPIRSGIYRIQWRIDLIRLRNLSLTGNLQSVGKERDVHFYEESPSRSRTLLVDMHGKPTFSE